jgi:hypothetical protein
MGKAEGPSRFFRGDRPEAGAELAMTGGSRLTYFWASPKGRGISGERPLEAIGLFTLREPFYFAVPRSATKVRVQSPFEASAIGRHQEAADKEHHRGENVSFVRQAQPGGIL